MFIYTNCKDNLEFNIKTKNNRIEIEANPGLFSYKATEKNLPVQFFCIPCNSVEYEQKIENKLINEYKINYNNTNFTDKNQIIKLNVNNFKPAKVFCIETIYEKNLKIEEEITYVNLINDFGDKGSRERLKKRKMQSTKSINGMQIKLPNLLLPEFNKNTENIEEIYKMDFLFSDETLRNIKKMDLEIDDLCPYIVKNTYSESKKDIYIAINAIYKVLKMNFIKKEKIDQEYQFILEDIKKDINKDKLNPVGKDRLIIKLYILLLKANNYIMLLDQFPKFSSNKTKLFTMLKCIGCTFSGDGTVKLTKKPIESFNLK